MFLRYNTRKKDGKEHRYWSVVENRRLRVGHTTQRTVLYLGEVNDTQEPGPAPEGTGHPPQNCFLAFCLSVTLRKRLQAHAPGLTSRAVLETLSGILMLDVHVPLAEGRELVMPRYTQPQDEHRLVLEKLGWQLPAQPPPRIRRAQVPNAQTGPETKSKM